MNDIHNNHGRMNKSWTHNAPLICTVSHTISTQPRSTFISPFAIKMVFFFLLSIISIILTIIIFATGQKSKIYTCQPSLSPIDGQWSDWSAWSQCSLTCSDKFHPFGTMTRIRYCNYPVSRINGTICKEISVETSECFKSTCPIPVDGNWAVWSSWSSCSATCQTSGFIPTQWRGSSCSNPTPKDGGKQCEGTNIKKRFCTWLPQCPVNEEWGEWIIAGQCESSNRKPCSPGKRLYQRKCKGQCLGLKEKTEDCWFEIGCPIDLQPPLNVQVYGNGTGLFQVQWSGVPYGVVAVKYRIYLTIEDYKKSQVETIDSNITAIPPDDINGRIYLAILDLRRFLNSSKFSKLVVRMSSVDYLGKESILSTNVSTNAKAVDGQWGNWDHWSECSTQCSNKRGVRIRGRMCNQPAPSEDGNQCYGSSKEEVSCIGMEKDC